MPETKDGGWILDDGVLNINRYSSVCFDCVHLMNCHSPECKVFNNISVEICHGKNYHAKLFPGDHGIRFELCEKEKDE